jgi:prepilin-type N-terminal cleavage/methylation domain-containing protein
MKLTGRNSGFSLVEVLCAILILGVALVGLTQGITVALQSSKESELQATAALFAAGQIESLRAEGGFKDGEQDSESDEGASLYRWKQTIAGTGIAGLHEVAVVVENSRSGKVIYELRTMLFEPVDVPTLVNSQSRKRSESRARRSR